MYVFTDISFYVHSLNEHQTGWLIGWLVELLLTFGRTVNFGYGFCWDPRPYFCSF
jgi:hypothetical protein